MEKRTDHMAYQEGMERIDTDIPRKVINRMEAYDYHVYTEKEVKAALAKETCGIEEFEALLSPAAERFLEEIAQKARAETRKHFGNTVYMFTPLYIANYCQNHCIYCGFNCQNKIRRARLKPEEIEEEMEKIAASGLEEILILTGESRKMSDVEYIGEACKTARKYFKVIGLEIYTVNAE